MKRVTILILAFSIGIGSLHAQSALERLGKRIVKRTSEQVEQRIERKVEEGVEKAMDKAEESALKSGKENEKTTQPANEKSKEPKTIQQPQKEQVALQSFSQYDFVPGDKVLLFEHHLHLISQR